MVYRADITFYEGSTSGAFQKVVRSRGIEKTESAMPGYARSAISVSVQPNPVQDRATVRVRTSEAGIVRLSVYSSLGERLADLPAIEAETAGDYVVEMSIDGALPGMYIVRAEGQHAYGAAQFTVVR